MKNLFLNKWMVATAALFTALFLTALYALKKIAVDELVIVGKEIKEATINGLAADPCGCEHPAINTIVLPTLISRNMTLSCGNLYLLDGKTYVTAGAVLKVPAGTRIEAIYKSDPDLASALIVTKGSKIEAIGTAACPIVLTAHIDLSNPTLSSGDWGGLVLLDKTEVSRPVFLEISGGSYVDSVWDDNFGSLSYVHIEYAGAKCYFDDKTVSLSLKEKVN